MTREHWLLIAALGAAIGGMGDAHAQTWGEMLTPRFVLSAVLAVSVQIRGIYTERP